MALRIPQSHHNARLDQALTLLLPDMGRRGRARCIQDGRVLLDGATARKGDTVRAGQRLELLPPDSPQTFHPDIAILARTRLYAALLKPAGIHSAALAGGSGRSMEDLLPQLFGAQACLLNRLDHATSGILLVGLAAGSEKDFRAMEDAGDVDKRYLAVLAGSLDQPLTVDAGLDTARRSRTRVLETTAPPLRHTRLRPLACREEHGRQLTLVEARIRKGARHQIRAHCAHIGAPILGDELYGEKGATGLHLHHACLRMPGFEAQSLPDWLWPEANPLFLEGLERSCPSDRAAD